ncbi:hypothetical protein HanXRQr2_Chr03g0135921 [Helianthus annuus]|uniref:Uncharacterized protein n=1 Tax=Helianthus annuus TaxID=4232 RepID=A0A251VBW2_HELAN|nr:hypothetical protein HanXRQr2_Chr03g0135921 [Helianthus annuus]KAJ0594826.1 hypothetical protein HanHA300_Chr03g0112681 [Helianthus annuus]KAJ0603135.1 hypothetical protein HanIR_Chr03g0147221 [Helianthus annuus]
MSNFMTSSVAKPLYKSNTSRLKRFPSPPISASPQSIVFLFLPSRICWLLLPSLYSPKINFVQDLNTDPKLASEDNYVDVITNVVRVVHRYSHNLEPGYD